MDIDDGERIEVKCEGRVKELNLDLVEKSIDF
jgi:hypothetical protein